MEKKNNIRKFLDRILLNNFGYKLLSLVIAVMTWLVIINIADPITTKSFSGLEVEIRNQSKIESINQVYEIVEGSTVDFTVKGKSSIVKNLKLADFSAYADLANLSPVLATDIKVKCNKYESLEIDHSNRMLVVKLEDVDSKNMQVNVETKGDVADGYYVGDVEVKPNMVTVSGAASKVDSIDTVKVVINVSGAKKDFSDKIEPVAYDKDGNKIDSTNLTFKNNGSRVTDITVNVTVYNTKTIPIELEVIGEPAEGYVFTDQLESSPDAIVVGGVTKRLAKMTTLKIPVDITGASNEYETNISLDEYLPDGIKLVNSDVKLSVRVMLERVITKSIDLTKADIEMRNLQSGYKAVYIDETDEITIQLQGTQSQLKDFTSKSIGAYIDLSSAKEGEYYFQLQFDNISEKFLVQAVQLVHLSVKDGVTKPESTPNATPSPMPDNEAEQTSPPLID